MEIVWIVIGMILASIPWFFVWRNNKKGFERADIFVNQFIKLATDELNKSELAENVKIKLNTFLDKIPYFIRNKRQ